MKSPVQPRQSDFDPWRGRGRSSVQTERRPTAPSNRSDHFGVADLAHHFALAWRTKRFEQAGFGDWRIPPDRYLLFALRRPDRPSRWSSELHSRRLQPGSPPLSPAMSLIRSGWIDVAMATSGNMFCSTRAKAELDATHHSSG